MAAKHIIVVFGATGKQGGSVVQALLRDGKYAVRGVTRDVSKPAAKSLTAKGVEMVSVSCSRISITASKSLDYNPSFLASLLTENRRTSMTRNLWSML